MSRDPRPLAGAWRAAAAGLALAAALGGALAREAPPVADDPVLEAKVLRISAELRCLVCQNQTIADSHADLAVDLRRQVREMLQRGAGEREVLDYMTARYGDFVLYRPPLKSTTWVLWFAPGVLLVGGATVLWLVLRRRSRLDPDRFEPDLDEEPPSDGPASPPPPR